MYVPLSAIVHTYYIYTYVEIDCLDIATEKFDLIVIKYYKTLLITKVIFWLIFLTKL